MLYVETYDMQTVDWKCDGRLDHLRTFIKEGQIGNTTIISPAFARLALSNPYNKNKQWKIRHLGTSVQFNASDHGLITVGPQAYFGDNCVLYASGSKITIGEHLKMAPGSAVYASYHDTFDKNLTVKGEVRIGDSVWLAQNAVVLRGVTIADNCTVGANSVVTKSFLEPYSVIAGNPAKLIKIATEGHE